MFSFKESMYFYTSELITLVQLVLIEKILSRQLKSIVSQYLFLSRCVLFTIVSFFAISDKKRQSREYHNKTKRRSQDTARSRQRRSIM